MQLFLNHNFQPLANAKIKANFFAHIKNLVFNKMYVIKISSASRGLPQEYKIFPCSNPCFKISIHLLN